MDLKVNYFQLNRCCSAHFRTTHACFAEITQIAFGKVHLSRNKFIKEFGVLTVDQDGLLFL